MGKTNCYSNEVTREKNLQLWSSSERETAGWNNKGLNVIFTSVSAEEFIRISNCETSKEAWDILCTTHEGTKAVRDSKLQMIISKFEELRIKEDECFDDFYGKLTNLVNLSFSLGEKMAESKVVCKVLRSLPERFRPEVTAIEESKILLVVLSFLCFPFRCVCCTSFVFLSYSFSFNLNVGLTGKKK